MRTEIPVSILVHLPKQDTGTYGKKRPLLSLSDTGSPK